MFAIALINGIYIFVQDESVDYGVEITSHPVEKGINISDHARRQPYTLKLRGEIVGEDAPEKRSQIEQLLNNAALINYQGRNIKTSGIIESLSTGHPNTIYGGCSFDMTIKEIRVANGSGFIGNTTPTVTQTTPLKDPQETGTQKVEKNSTTDEVYTARNGDSVYSEFVGGGLKNYVEFLENNPYVDPTNIKAGTKITVEKSKTKNIHGGGGTKLPEVTPTAKAIKTIKDRISETFKGAAEDLKVLFGGYSKSDNHGGGGTGF